MLDNLPLRSRLSLLLGAVVAAGLVFGVGLLTLQAGARIRAEAEAATSLAQDVVEDALLRAQTAPDADAELARLVEQAKKFRHIRIYLETGGPPPAFAAIKRAPAWFARLISPHERISRIELSGRLRGAVLIALDPADEIAEIWQEIMGLAPGAALLALTAFALVSAATSRALAPISLLADNLARLERGERRLRVPSGGSPEFVVIAKRVNALASALERLDDENHRLLQSMIDVQEEERKDIARDLHDEIGPFLFAIRAGVGALRRKGAGFRLEADCARIDDQIAALQRVNRRILARLRPAALEEIGLAEALQALAQGWRDSHPETTIELRVADCPLDEARALAAYRIVQEGLTNAFRHAGPRHIEIEAGRATSSEMRICIRDDGAGLAEGWRPGLGLRGMSERLAALGGSLALENGPECGARLTALLPLQSLSPVGSFSV